MDRETAAPLGYTVDVGPDGVSTRDKRGRTVPLVSRAVVTVDRITALDPTPENLAHLRTFTLPRRRDADGCKRGPAEHAQSIDSRPRSDCGGTPGAPTDP